MMFATVTTVIRGILITLRLRKKKKIHARELGYIPYWEGKSLTHYTFEDITKEQ